MGSLAARKVREAYVARVRGNSHHVVVIAEMTTPITRIITLIGRRAADRSIVFRCSGGRGEDSLSSSGPDSGSRRSATAVLRKEEPHSSSDFQGEGLGRVALVYREAQAPVGVGDEHQFARPGGPEGLYVPDGHLTVAGIDLQGVTVLETRLLRGDREPRVAEVVDGDDAGGQPPAPVGRDAYRPQTAQRSRVHGLPEIRYPHPGHKMRRHRGEDVATVEGVGDRMQMIALLRERDGGGDAIQRLRRRNE